jgi:hypothetical protein
VSSVKVGSVTLETVKTSPADHDKPAKFSCHGASEAGA